MAFFITKNQAAHSIADFNTAFPERCFAVLIANAQNGTLGATISTTGIAGAAVTVATTLMTNAGWSVDSGSQPGFLVVT